MSTETKPAPTKTEEKPAAAKKPAAKKPAAKKAPAKASISKKVTPAQAKAKASISTMFPEELFTPTSFVIPEGTDYETWAKAVMLLEKVAEGIQFWLGDAILYGEQSEWAEKAEQAYSLTGLEPKTLMEYRRICSRIAPADRIPEIGWTNHKYAADTLGGPDGSSAKVKAALKHCAKHNLTSREMAEYCNEKAGKNAPTDDDADSEIDKSDPTRRSLSLVMYVDADEFAQGKSIMKRLAEAAQVETDKVGLHNPRITVSEK